MDGSYTYGLPDYANAIGQIESGNSYGKYGPRTRTGDRAHGRYQVMGDNIGPWSEAALGRRLTPQEFMSDPKAQDDVFNHRFGGYVAKYGNPQDAASAWFTGRPQNTAGSNTSSDVLGTTGSSYVDKFNRALGSPAPMSQAMAYAPQGNNPMEVIPAQRRAPGVYRPAGSYDQDGSLSSKFIAGGPGALFGAPNGVLQNADGTPGYDVGSAMSGAGAALAGISSPAQGAALTAQLAAMQPKAGRYSTKVDRERGVIGLTDAQTGAYSEVPLPGHDPKYKQNDAFDVDQAKKFSDLNASIPAAAIEAKQHQATLGQLEPILSNDKVYQGAGGEQWQQAKKIANATGLFNFEGTAEGDAAKSLIAGLTLQSRNMQGGMPGSLSDKDLAFLKTMPPSLDNTKEANLWIVGNMKALHQRTIDYNNWRQEYADAHGGRLDNNFYKFAQQKADQNPIFKEGNVPPAGKAAVDRKPLGDIFK